MTGASDMQGEDQFVFGTWYPIETAPKDGAKILLYYPHGGDYVTESDMNPPIMAVMSADERGYWQGYYSGTTPNGAATHWMPLPPAPGSVLPPSPRDEVVEALRSIPAAAIDQLRNYQTQLDMDGIQVGVSRQAIEEVLTGVEAALSQIEERP